MKKCEYPCGTNNDKKRSTESWRLNNITHNEFPTIVKKIIPLSALPSYNNDSDDNDACDDSSTS